MLLYIGGSFFNSISPAGHILYRMWIILQPIRPDCRPSIRDCVKKPGDTMVE